MLYAVMPRDTFITDDVKIGVFSKVHFFYLIHNFVDLDHCAQNERGQRTSRYVTVFLKDTGVHGKISRCMRDSALLRIRTLNKTL